MRRIEDVGQPFAGRSVTLISAGESTADYLDATETEDIVLINWALSLAPLFFCGASIMSRCTMNAL